MWRRTYLLLILVRLYFALSPSYLHPDENFQGPEVIAGRSIALAKLPELSVVLLGRAHASGDPQRRKNLSLSFQIIRNRYANLSLTHRPDFQLSSQADLGIYL
jgi:hypothetical protein